jgi:hypothetical protein
VKEQQEIGEFAGGFVGPLTDGGYFGSGLSDTGDRNGDGIGDLTVGARFLGAGSEGGLWTLFLDGQFRPGWVQLGAGLPGSNGVPSLVGTGTLVAGEPVAVRLENALPRSLSWIVMGTVTGYAPLRGGILVPAVDFLFPSTTDDLGRIELDGLWPPGVPPGSTNYFQVWTEDPAGVQGYAASNGIAAVNP